MSKALPLFVEPRLSISEKVSLQGRFFFLNDEKFFLKGVTYGPFSPSNEGVPFPEAARVETDFALIVELGANCLRTFTPPPDWLLDMAASYGLRVIIGIPWAQHISFLDSPRTQSEVRKTIACNVEQCRRHAATFAYLIGNEISPEIVRWHGSKHIRSFLGDLFDSAKSADPDRFVSYANFPSTEYLETDFADFLAFNVYLHREEDFRRYLSHLHNLAGDRPLVLPKLASTRSVKGAIFRLNSRLAIARRLRDWRGRNGDLFLD